MNKSEQKFFNNALAALPYAIDETKTQQLADYLALLNQWNRVYNLTAIQDVSEQITHHLLDSLAIVPYIKESRVLDVGTGAGLPGIILAIMLPEQQFTLLDSNGKKTRFLVQAKAALQLSNVEVVHSRAQSYREQAAFDAIITRAVAVMADTIANTHHLLKPSGRYWFMKGKHPEQELNDVQATVNVHTIDVPLLPEDRHLIELTDVIQ